MGPLHVQFDLACPIRVGRREGGGGGLSGSIDTYLDKVGSRQAELTVEHRQIAGNAWVVVGIDEGNGLTAAVPGNRVAVVREADGVDSVGVPHLGGTQPRGIRTIG